MPVPSLPPAGWYPDPVQPGWVRWFDGTAWTGTVSPAAQPVAPHFAQPAVLPAGAAHDDLRWVLPVGRTWQSVAAGYVALFAVLVWPLGPACLALGVAGLRAADRKGLGGRGRSWFGVVVGALSTLAMLWWAFSSLAG